MSSVVGSRKQVSKQDSVILTGRVFGQDGRGPWSTSSANVNVNYRFPPGSWDRIGSGVNSSSCGPRMYSYREKGEQSQSCCCS